MDSDSFAKNLDENAAAQPTNAPDKPESFCNTDHVTVLPTLERFAQPNDMFCRGFWDEKIARNKMTRLFFRSFVKPEERMRDLDGFHQRDYAVRNGPWVVTEMLAEMHKAKDRRDGFWDDFSPHLPPTLEPIEVKDPHMMSADVKKVAKLYGADLVGITDYDERWTYASKFSARGGEPASKPVEIPPGLTNCIVFARQMDYETIRTSPSATASTAPAIGYAHDAAILLALAQFIRSLGYRAVACQNDTTLAIPYAIKAGLGEYGRNGLCITKEFGPRIRLGRILTDLPLAHDAPISFGVAETCEKCRRCANNCPPQAISHGAPSEYQFNRSNIKGVRKWSTDGEKCFRFWVSQGSDCANCVRTCPYNKDHTKLRYRFIRYLLSTRLRRIGLLIDDRLRLHDQLAPALWWNRLSKAIQKPEPAYDHQLIPEKVALQERAIRIRNKRRADAGEDAAVPPR